MMVAKNDMLISTFGYLYYLILWRIEDGMLSWLNKCRWGGDGIFQTNGWNFRYIFVFEKNINKWQWS
jgi:hypothetical protein